MTADVMVGGGWVSRGGAKRHVSMITVLNRFTALFRFAVLDCFQNALAPAASHPVCLSVCSRLDADGKSSFVHLTLSFS